MTMIRDARTIEGEPEARAKVMAFLEANVRQGVETEGDVLIKLVEKTKTGEASVDDFPYSLDESLDALADAIVEVAARVAEQWPGKTRFAIRIDGRVKYQSFVLDRPKIDVDEGDELGDFEENTNKKGLLGLLMRHNETSHKLGINAAKDGRDSLVAQNRELQGQVNQLTKQLFDQNKFIEEIRNLQFMRDMEVKKFEADQKRKDQVAGGLMLAGKMVANSYLQKQGGAGLPDTPSPFVATAQDLFASLEKDEERLNEIGKLLTPVEIAALFQMRAQLQEMQAANGGPLPSAASSAMAPSPPEQPNVPSNGTSGGAAYVPWTPSFSPGQ